MNFEVAKFSYEDLDFVFYSVIDENRYHIKVYETSAYGEEHIGDMILEKDSLFPNFMLVTDVMIDDDKLKIGVESRRIGTKLYKFALQTAKSLGFDGLSSRAENQNSITANLWFKYHNSFDSKTDTFFMTSYNMIKESMSFKKFLKEE